MPLSEQDRRSWDAADLRGPGDRPPVPAPRGTGSLPDPGGDQRRPLRRAHREDTDWKQILGLYDQLLAIAPGPRRRAAPRGRPGRGSRSPAALASVEGLELERYYMFHAIRADLLRRLGRDAEAAEAYRDARTLTQNKTERALLTRRIQERRTAR